MEVVTKPIDIGAVLVVGAVSGAVLEERSKPSDETGGTSR